MGQPVTNRWYQSSCIVGARLSSLFRGWVSLSLPNPCRLARKCPPQEKEAGEATGPTIFFVSFFWGGVRVHESLGDANRECLGCCWGESRRQTLRPGGAFQKSSFSGWRSVACALVFFPESTQVPWPQRASPSPSPSVCAHPSDLKNQSCWVDLFYLSALPVTSQRASPEGCQCRERAVWAVGC